MNKYFNHARRLMAVHAVLAGLALLPVLSQAGVVVVTPPTTPGTLSLVQGWNLVGNSMEAPMAVAANFNDATKVTTIWKWVTSGSTPGIVYPAWAFYSPVQADGGQAYAASKGYDFLTTIQAGEGFWVNAKTPFTAALPTGAAVQPSSFMPALASPPTVGGTHALVRGWNLIATGANPTPTQLNAAIATSASTPPAAGQISTNLTTLWAWNASAPGWYFWAPGLVNNGTLGSYLSTKGYFDFATLPGTTAGTLSPTTGAWVNVP